MTGLQYHAQVFYWSRWGLSNPSFWPGTPIVLTSTSQVAGITGVSHCTFILVPNPVTISFLSSPSFFCSLLPSLLPSFLSLSLSLSLIFDGISDLTQGLTLAKQSLYLLSLFFREGLMLLPAASLKPRSSYLCLLSSWDYKHV
jgi:hypothetical protein